ncbi:SdpI family protein [Olsenella sp. An290]|uniref:SdpI family protein n=1 Tax=Olsenella sp. An290 TaxID=1965625 RepID=UPI000B36B64A|nr:SdpI family protein [Olsenella sp. An290]OUO35956.1 hypothetical protein B5F84_01195 [Olsenella sp. An290]
MKIELGRGERAFWVVLFAVVVVHLAAYALLAYPAMPETVPTHWGADGAVDGWGDKAGTLVMAAMPLVVALVMLAVPRLDPKGRNFERFRGVYLGMSAAITLFMVAVSWMTPLTASGLVPEGGSLVSTAILFALGALMIALGNYLPRVKPNYTFGIRTPWTLASEDNWRHTHRFAGPVFVVAGAAMLVAALLSSVAPEASFWVGMAAVLVATLVVGVYSFLVWRREGR